MIDGDIKPNVMPLMPMARGKPEPVQAVPPVQPEQNLPGSGNALPQAKEKTNEKGEKIRQIPSEEVLALARNLDPEATTGLIISADT